MAPSGLPLAFFVAALWAVIFVDVRPAFTGLFQSRVQPHASMDLRHDLMRFQP
jgi:hypothetical protein